MPKRSPPDPTRMTTTEVALALHVRYQKARDLMLQGRLGNATLAPILTVPRTAVEAYHAQLAAKRGARGAAPK